MHTDHKSARKTNSLTVFFVLLGSVQIKASSKMLVKLTQGEFQKAGRRRRGKDKYFLMN